MTCIVGLVHENKVMLGGDSAALANLNIAAMRDKKVFKNHDFVFGYMGSFRLGQLLQYRFIPPKIRDSNIMSYLVNEFATAIRTMLAEAECSLEDSAFLIGIHGRLFEMNLDYSISETILPFTAIGCGADFALGSLYTTEGETPAYRLEKALETAGAFSAGVMAPFHYVEA